MKTTGRIVGLARDFKTRQPVVQLAIEDNFEHLEPLQGKELSIEIKRARKRRSNDANAMLWACCADIANAAGTTKWEVYLEELRRWGTFQYMEVEPRMVERLKEIWRVVDVIDDSGELVKMHCYYGSHTYDTKEFSILLDGVVADMKEMGLPLPPSKEMQRALKEYEEDMPR